MNTNFCPKPSKCKITIKVNGCRFYVLDQSRIKDIRTGIESSNTQDVLDGNLDKFIEASLKAGY
jgi:protein subunit release factor B